MNRITPLAFVITVVCLTAISGSNRSGGSPMVSPANAFVPDCATPFPSASSRPARYAIAQGKEGGDQDCEKIKQDIKQPGWQDPTGLSRKPDRLLALERMATSVRRSEARLTPPVWKPWLASSLSEKDHGAVPPLAPSPVPAGAQQNTSVAEAESRIKEYIATIEARQKVMDALYFEGNAPKTFDRVIKEASARDGRDYSGNNVNSNYLRWNWGSFGARVQSYYQDHATSLKQSLEVIETQGFVTAKQMAYLDKGMADWKQYEPRVETVYSDYTLFLATHSIDSTTELDYSGSAFGPLHGLAKTWFSEIKPTEGGSAIGANKREGP